jgi:UDP-N-acetylmuramate--alanine ligase
MENDLRIVISGGGTGGHIFPAIAIANAVKMRYPNAEILFVGAEGRMEMEKVPKEGYNIVGLPVAGFDRKNFLKNIPVFFKLMKSMALAKKTLKDFKPDIVVGVGGYASGPTLKEANLLGIPTLIQEQNSYAGVTNKLLADKAAKICVAYSGMEKFFPADKIVLTGNPVRKGLVCSDERRNKAYSFFGLDPDMKTVLVIGGSLGAKTLNDSILAALPNMHEKDIQFLWQSGKTYYHDCLKKSDPYHATSYVHLVDFISRMDLAYSVADLIISRAGASSISELCIIGKPVILVPSPNVAEDHQTKNAMALVEKNAAVMVADADAVKNLIPTALKLVRDTDRLDELSDNISHLALPDAANRIVEEIEEILCHSQFDCHWLPPNVVSREGGNDRGANFQFIYFLGAGGIGMSALVRYFLSKGKKVAGYDRVESDLTRQLNSEGAAIHYEDKIDLIPEPFLDRNRTLVVLTPAIPDDHSELNYFRELGFKIMKRAQVLGEITKSSRGLCVAGTHGKTTTSSMIAHILKQSPIDCNAFLGGILKNYDSNLMLSATSDLTVIEADEYDRSFHWLSPWMAVITSVSPDHLDIYGTEEAYREGFEKFASLVRPDGTLLLESGADIKLDLKEGVKVYRYGKGNFYAENIRMGNGEIVFDFVTPEKTIKDINLGVPVEINIANSVAAMAIAYLNGVSDDDIRSAMASFRGAKRRFDFHIKRDDLVLIDDYAHHPDELAASISSVRKLYADKKLTVVFQPHLYTRTRDFYQGFAASLSLADEVMLIPIYPAREAPIEGVSSQIILDLVTSKEKYLFTKTELLEHIKQGSYEVMLIAGAGDIELLVEPIKEILENG